VELYPPSPIRLHGVVILYKKKKAQGKLHLLPYEIVIKILKSVNCKNENKKLFFIHSVEKGRD